MEAYIILIVILDITVMAGMTLHGMHKGITRLISELVSLIVSIIVVLLLSGVVNSYEVGDKWNLWIGFLLLAVLGLVYKVIHMLMNALRFIARLPIISWLNKGLGAVAGFCEGFAILYIGEYLLRMYLLR